MYIDVALVDEYFLVTRDFAIYVSGVYVGDFSGFGELIEVRIEIAAAHFLYTTEAVFQCVGRTGDEVEKAFVLFGLVHESSGST